MGLKTYFIKWHTTNAICLEDDLQPIAFKLFLAHHNEPKLWDMVEHNLKSDVESKSKILGDSVFKDSKSFEALMRIKAIAKKREKKSHTTHAIWDAFHHVFATGVGKLWVQSMDDDKSNEKNEKSNEKKEKSNE